MFSLVGQQLGNYRLHSLLGRGGFADVYLGEHILLQTRAAIKVLHAETTQLHRFIQEARVVAQFRHPHVVRVLDFGFSDATPFLVMDFAASGSLRQLHPHGAILPLVTIVSYVKQVASALHYAHQRKVIHRDVKPENMFMDADGSLLLGDFGLAIASHSTQSLSTQAPFGTVHYMAPEQLRGKARMASDQYALAIAVYEWLSGTYPFDGESSISIALHHLMDEPQGLRERFPNIASAIEQVVMRALSKEPYDRYKTILDFAASLEAACQPYILPEIYAPSVIPETFHKTLHLESTQIVEPDTQPGHNNEISGPSGEASMIPLEIHI